MRLHHTACDPKRRRAGALQNPRKSAFICGLFFFVLLAANNVLAQGGGKAEPNRIKFPPGANTTTVSGTVRNDQQTEYVLAAKKGQYAVFHITSTPTQSCVFELHGPNNEVLASDTLYYGVTLQANGDYLIFVSRSAGPPGRSTYKLKVEVK